MPARGAWSTRKRTLAASIDGGWGRLEDPECLREVLGALERGPWQPRSMGGGVDWRTLSASARCPEHPKMDPGSLDRWGVGSKRGP